MCIIRGWGRRRGEGGGRFFNARLTCNCRYQHTRTTTTAFIIMAISSTSLTYSSRSGCNSHKVCGTLFFAYTMSSASPRSTSSKRKTPPSLSGSDCEGAFSEVLTRQARRKQKKVNKHRPEFQFNIQELKYGKKVTLAVSLARISCL